MNWTNKLRNLRTEALIELGRALEKGYDKTELDGQQQLDLPYAIYYGDFGSEIFSLIYWDKEEEYFTGKSWDTGDYYYFQLIELDTQCICRLIDIINEQNKV
jgi:hypothetical protein